MEMPEKIQQAVTTLIKDKSEDLVTLGMLVFDDAWGIVRKKIEYVLTKGEQSPPVLVLRLSDGTYELVEINKWPHNIQKHVLVDLITKAGLLIGERRVVGAVVFSEAYTASIPAQGGFENNELEEGEVAGSREVLLAALFDGLIDSAETYVANIERPFEGEPHLGDWECNFAADDDLIEGLAMGAMIHNLYLLGFTPEVLEQILQVAESN